MTYQPLNLLWTSPISPAGARLRDYEPSRGWSGWLTVLGVLGGFGSLLICGMPY